MRDTYGKLTALAVYNTNCFHTNFTKRVQIEFGLGKEVSVNTGIGIPTLKRRKIVSDLRVIFLPHPFLKHNYFLFINLLTL